MGRATVFAVIVLLLGAATVLMQGREDPITLSAGKAVPMGVPGLFMVTLDIANDGPADRLLSITSPDAAHSGLMNPKAPEAPLVVPGQDRAQLAMDGAHLVVRLDGDAPEEGGFIPVVLQFERAGAVSARLQTSGPSAMDHNAPGLESAPAAALQLSWAEGPGPAGGRVAVDVENVRFVQVEEGAAHVPGEGHAHAYLNGLKLGRVYGESLELGALLPGEYALTISLNTHDHRPYLAQGAPVSQTLRFTIDE